jgi:hypothetical protein
MGSFHRPLETANAIFQQSVSGFFTFGLRAKSIGSCEAYFKGWRLIKTNLPFISLSPVYPSAHIMLGG